MKLESFRVAEATPADLDDLSALEGRSFEDPWTAVQLAGELTRREDLFLLLRDGSDGALAGYASWRRTLEEAELLRIAVAPSRRRRGLARRLLAAGLERLADAGVRVCFLEVRPDNRAASALYRGLGFRLAGSRPGYYRDGSPAELYRLELPPGNLSGSSPPRSAP